MPSRETGKQRAERIGPDYFRGGNRLDRGRVILAAIAAAVAIGGWGVGLVASRRSDLWASPGPVAAAHATIETKCATCHVEFTPIRDDAWAKLWSADRHAADANCRACHHDLSHDKADPLGHHLTTNADSLCCSTCHHEHRGRTQLLAHTADSSCTMCHSREKVAELLVDQTNSLLPKGAAGWSKVTTFDVDHPDFRSLANSDPRKLKFTRFAHRLHMTPGMAVDKDHKPVFAVGMLATTADKARYAPGQPDEDLVTLDCASCHQLQGAGVAAKQATGLPSAVASKDSSGAYMQPVVFELHCQVCHPLAIDPSNESRSVDGLAAAAEPEATVPHRLARDKLAAAVRSHLEHRYLTEHPEAVKTLSPKPDHPFAENKEAEAWIKDRITASLNHLRATCQKCHEYDDRRLDSKAIDDKLADELLPLVAPVAVPGPWLQFAKFNHAAHRSTTLNGRPIRCDDCHRGANGDDQSTATDSAATSSASDIANDAARSPLMLPHRDICLKCHTTQSDGTTASPGGARTDCFECHRFHGR
jgi:hypothetical protein